MCAKYVEQYHKRTITLPLGSSDQVCKAAMHKTQLQLLNKLLII